MFLKTFCEKQNIARSVNAVRLDLLTKVLCGLILPFALSSHELVPSCQIHTNTKTCSLK